MKKTRNWLLSLLLQNFKEDDIQQAPRGDALDHDEPGVVGVLLLPGVRDGHPDTDTDGRHHAEDRHVQDGNQGTKLEYDTEINYSKSWMLVVEIIW